MAYKPGTYVRQQVELHSTNAIAAAMEVENELAVLELQTKRVEKRLSQLRSHLRGLNRSLVDLDPEPPPTASALRKRAA